MRNEKRDFNRTESRPARFAKPASFNKPKSLKRPSSFKKPGNTPGGTFTKNPVVYIGNLNYKRDDFGIMKLFKPFGYVEKVNLIMDEKTEKSKGIAFVEMQTKKAAEEAVAALNGRVIDGRTVKVSIAQEREGMAAPEKNRARAPQVAPISKKLQKANIKKDKVKRVGLNLLFENTNK